MKSVALDDSVAHGPDRREQVPRPYDLGSCQESLGEFQCALGMLADEFMGEADRAAGALLDEQMARLAQQAAEVPRSRGEYAIELLTFGVLRAEYGDLASSTKAGVMTRLAELWHLRSTDPAQKAEADSERGRRFLELLTTERARSSAAVVDDARLVEWLAATGEFVQEALRMRTWLDGTSAPDQRRAFVQITQELALWFVPRAKQRLGKWTQGVAAFREYVLSRLEPREDLFLITRSESLYHLNMVGSEVMNRGFLPGYAERPAKVVLIPGCMRARTDAECRAKREGLDISCTHCHRECEVAAIDKLGRARGFRVFVVPHASSFTAWLRHWQQDTRTALVAAACPLHLVPGGYEMRSLGLQAQCVLLNFSGCRRHWDPTGTPTRLDPTRLLAIVHPQDHR